MQHLLRAQPRARHPRWVLDLRQRRRAIAPGKNEIARPVAAGDHRLVPAVVRAATMDWGSRAVPLTGDIEVAQGWGAG